MTTISEDQKRFEEIIKKIKSLTKEAISLLPEPVYDRAESYWYTHIMTSLDEDHEISGISISDLACTMKNTLEEWEEFSMSSYIPSDSSVDGFYIEPKHDDSKMEFTYESVSDVLYEKHPNLSGEWSTLDWNETHAIASYILEDGTIENALVDREGNVKVSDKLMSVMRDI